MLVSRETWALLTLTVSAAVLGAAMAINGAATWLEAVSFLTGALCVWLTVKENIWNFPLGLANVATFCVVFFNAALYADASLQVVYFVLGVIGWYQWLHGGKERAPLRVSLAPTLERALVLVFIAALSVLLWQTLRFVGGSASFWDALTTAISLAAQWLLNRKRLENWIAWIVVDVIYIPLYLYKQLHLTSLLYGVFLVMATMGFFHWRKTWRAQRGGDAGALAPAGERP